MEGYEKRREEKWKRKIGLRAVREKEKEVDEREKED